MPQESLQFRVVLAVFVGVALLFATSVRQFIAVPTDLSAWRITLGDVPYRDFWTMYAPGSIVVLSWFFELFGREMLVSRLLAITTSALAVAMCCPLGARIGGRVFAFVPAVLVAVAFLHTGYYRAFGSYPPALLSILMSVWWLQRAHEQPSGTPRAWARVACSGLAGGIAVCFKHDVAGYSLIALGIASLAIGPGSWQVRRRNTAILAVCSASVVLALTGWLFSLGAANEAYDALIRFPLTDFSRVRVEPFPLVPRFTGSLERDLREAAYWTTCHGPGLVVVATMWILWRTPRAHPLPLVWWWALLAFPLFWGAAHVQLNTHAISMSLLAGLVGVAAAAPAMKGSSTRSAQVRLASCGLLAGGSAVWVLLLAVEPSYWLLRRALSSPRELELPHLTGIREPAAERASLRGLAAAISEAAPPGAPLLLVGARNDTIIFADPSPYWLSSRRPASRHHELHPAITDTERGQREILSAVATGRPPVVVREHRFDDETTDAVKRAYQVAGVPVGARALDLWIAMNYEPAARFGRYEVMRPRSISMREARDSDPQPRP